TPPAPPPPAPRPPGAPRPPPPAAPPPPPAHRPVGFTATSLNSVAAEPPLISFGIGTSSSSWPVLAEAEHVGVHILGEHQQELAATFARSGADRFGPSPEWRRGP
ncbi:flavin reductase family protein, partial [Streptomyces microflavus]|uniref:flavin reductase family protein n=1 Tax=Streptomyces microflavus TaxID=1919 RepID=UPI00368D791A